MTPVVMRVVQVVVVVVVVAMMAVVVVVVVVVVVLVTKYHVVRVGLGGVDVGWAESVAGVEEPRLLRGLKAEVDINRNCMNHNTVIMCLIGADAIAKEFVDRSSCYCFSSGKYSERLQNIARKGRNGRPAPCRPFCPFFHIRATFWSRSEYAKLKTLLTFRGCALAKENGRSSWPAWC